MVWSRALRQGNSDAESERRGAEYTAKRKRKRMRREVFLAEMDQIVPWSTVPSAIGPFYPVAGRGRPPDPIATPPRVHLMQNWFGLSDPAMEEALSEVTSVRCFAQLSMDRIPDETVLKVRHLLEANEVAPEIRAKVEHPFRVIKRQYGFMKVRFKRLAKNTGQVLTLFALADLWLVRKSSWR